MRITEILALFSRAGGSLHKGLNDWERIMQRGKQINVIHEVS